jgi:hypothetical protein
MQHPPSISVSQGGGGGTLKAASKPSISGEMYEVEAKWILHLTASSAIGVCMVQGNKETTKSEFRMSASRAGAAAGSAASMATACGGDGAG